MADLTKEGIYFLPLGGADDIGMNMYVYAVNGKMIVVDVGYGFLLDYPGMEMAYASPDFFDEHQEDILGLFITHAHEDHLGAIAQIWPHLKCPVYAMDFTIGLIKERLNEFKMADQVPLISVNQSRNVILPNFNVEFIPVAHSVPQTCALAIRTRYGNVLHATDWRFDDEALSMLPTDYAALQKFADEGVSLFVCDSTNVMLDQKTPTEADVRKNLIRLIPTIEGGIIVTCFASNMMRLESLMLAAEAAGRTPVLLGRSLATCVKIAKECGYLNTGAQACTIEAGKDIPADKALYICTGSQANYRSAMSLIANGESKYVKLDKSDTVIFSSKLIPGNEEKVERMQEKMHDLGATIITNETDLVHATGHACKEDLKKMYDLIKPAIVLPVHGDKRFIREHKRFASACGIKEVFSARNGDVCLLQNNHIHLEDTVITDVLGWDRSHAVSLSSQVIKNRRRIAFNCSMYISAVIKDKQLLDINVTSIDILNEEDWMNLIDEILQKVRPLISEKLLVTENRAQIEDFIRGQIRRRVFSATDIKPVTMLHIYYLDDCTSDEK
ncbi:MAG: ribonuclease J [Alphaproteobacteria bacterium]|nr:ribonuclease J [Alphaproteobacteria bacterium]